MTLSLAMSFLMQKPVTLTMKAKIDKMGFIKIKSFCSSKDTVRRIERQVTERRYFQNTCPVKDWYEIIRGR